MVDGYDRRVRLPLGIDSLDRALAGGLALGRVHLLSGAMQTHGAVSGFTIALLCMLQDYLSVKNQPIISSPLITQIKIRALSSGVRQASVVVLGCYMGMV